MWIMWITWWTVFIMGNRIRQKTAENAEKCAISGREDG